MTIDVVKEIIKELGRMKRKVQKDIDSTHEHDWQMQFYKGQKKILNECIRMVKREDVK